MPGRWQVKVLAALTLPSPLKQQAIQAHCGATTVSERQACKRAVWSLVRRGLVEKWRWGVYALAAKGRRLTTVGLLVCASLLLSGCATTSVMDIADALNARGIAHCLTIKAVTPYGTADLYARIGDLQCEAIWTGRRLDALP
jgi:hypothetical protein